MRTLGNIAGFLLILFGVLLALGGCVVGQFNPGGGIMFWFGIVLIVIGLVVSNSAAKKTCPHCSERVKYKAVKMQTLRQRTRAAAALIGVGTILQMKSRREPACGGTSGGTTWSGITFITIFRRPRLKRNRTHR
jgi:uncharacterized membrane protein YfcA